MPAQTAEFLGRLRARGYLHLKQFWPKGKSDADTANLIIDLANDRPFVFRPNDGAERTTRVFDKAQYEDRKVMKPVLGPKSDKLRVRLQGIDAPELHYKPNYRQRLAESAVVALGEMLMTLAAGQPSLRADVITFVDLPGDAFDMYGRYVGNVTVYADGFAVDVNHWLLEHGWAVPGLYNSMTEREILVARALSQSAARRNLGLYKSSYYKEKIVAFEEDLRYRSTKAVQSFKLYEDAGGVMNPKFFRRQVEHELRNLTAADPKTFAEALRTGAHTALLFDAYSKLPPADRRDPDKLKAKSVKLGKLLGRGGKLPSADDLINIEGPADLYDGNGNVIKKWDFKP